MDGFSDRGSTPLRSTNLIRVRKSENAVFMQVFALFVFLKKVVLGGFGPLEFKKSGVKNGVRKRT